MAGEGEFQMNFGDDEDLDNAEVTVPIEVSATGDVTLRKEQPAPAAGAAADADPVVDLKNQFAQMSQRATAAEAAAAQAAQAAQQATQRVQQLEGEVVGSQLDTVVTGLEAAKSEADAAERDYAVAFEAGDGMAMARAQRHMANAEARTLTLTGAKDELEEAVKRKPAPTSPTNQRAAPPPTDPIERFTKGMSARSAAWIRAHPECVTDPKLNARMLAAHNLAVAEDVPVDSDEYFRRIEDGVKIVKRAEEPQPGRRPTAPAAPAGGGTGGSPLNGGGIDVKLTKREARSATDGTLVWNYDDPSGQNRFKKGDPIGLAEMARRKHYGQRAGLYDKSLTEQ